MSGHDRLDQLTVHTVVVDNQNLDHVSALQTRMHGAARLDVSQTQPNTGDASGEENDRISPEVAQNSHARQGGRVDLVHLVCFVYLVRLVQPNKPNDQINKRNQPVLALHASRSEELKILLSILLGRRRR